MPALIEQTANVRAVGVHDVYLRRAAAIGNKRDFPAGLRVPYGGTVDGLTAHRQPPHVLSVPVGNVNFGAGPIPAAGKSDFSAVGRPGRPACGTSGPFERIRPMVD